MSDEIQGKPCLRDLNAAKLYAADSMPLPSTMPPVARWRSATARSGMKEMPYEFETGAWVRSRDRDPKPPTPTSHRPLRASISQRCYDRLDNFV